MCQDFLPKLAKANEEMEQRIAADPSVRKEYDLEDVEGAQKYIDLTTFKVPEDHAAFQQVRVVAFAICRDREGLDMHRFVLFEGV